MTLLHGLGHIASGRLRSQPGMVLIKPTSIAHSGTSASIGTNGQVTFTAVTSLSLNGVFSATYDNYVVGMRCKATTNWVDLNFRLRLSGSDASGSNYTWQYIFASSTTVSGGRTSSATSASMASADDDYDNNGNQIYFYGPALAQPTAMRNINVVHANGAALQDVAATHSLSTAYDGFTFTPASGNVTGTLQVYGIRG